MTVKKITLYLSVIVVPCFADIPYLKKAQYYSQLIIAQKLSFTEVVALLTAVLLLGCLTILWIRRWKKRKFIKKVRIHHKAHLTKDRVANSLLSENDSVWAAVHRRKKHNIRRGNVDTTFNLSRELIDQLESLALQYNVRQDSLVEHAVKEVISRQDGRRR